jgi:hypothetical protein
MPWSSGIESGTVVDRHLEPAGGEGGGGARADERPAAPPVAVLDGLEQEAGLVVAAQRAKAATGVIRKSARQLAPHGHVA